MKHPYYSFYSSDGRRFYFTSEGKRNILKVVEFTTVNDTLFNLGFGDVLPEGGYDDLAISDNGDLTKVIATVVQIIILFTSSELPVKIMFLGSTHQRMGLYNRVIRTYYTEFSKRFVINAAVKNETQLAEIIYKPDIVLDCFCYFIIRKN